MLLGPVAFGSPFRGVPSGQAGTTALNTGSTALEAISAAAEAEGSSTPVPYPGLPEQAAGWRLSSRLGRARDEVKALRPMAARVLRVWPAGAVAWWGLGWLIICLQAQLCWPLPGSQAWGPR